MNTYVHTHTHTHVPHIDFHCNTGSVAPTCTYTACGVSGATNTSRVHSKSGVYIIIGDQTLPKGGVSPRKVPPPPPPYPTHHTGSAGHLDWTVELLWPHPPDVQACTSMYAVNSCSPYTVYGIGQGRDLPLPPPIHPLVCP